MAGRTLSNTRIEAIHPMAAIRPASDTLTSFRGERPEALRLDAPCVHDTPKFMQAHQAAAERRSHHGSIDEANASGISADPDVTTVDEPRDESTGKFFPGEIFSSCTLETYSRVGNHYEDRYGNFIPT